MLLYQTGAMRPIPEMGHQRSSVEKSTCTAPKATRDPATLWPRGRNAAKPIYSDLNLDFRMAVATKKTAKS
jgi:hypothetical protein